MRTYDLKTQQEFLDFIRPLRALTVFGPSLPVPLDRVKGMTIDVIAGQAAPPTWTEEAKKRGARVKVWLLPGRVAEGSFFVADDRYLFTRTQGGWRVLESPEVALIVKAYLARAMQVAAEMGVVR
ncbi:hypothetical protein [Fervidobacterium sp.]